MPVAGPEGTDGLHLVPRKKMYVGSLEESTEKLSHKMTVDATEEWHRFFEGVNATIKCPSCDKILKALNKNRSNHLDDIKVAKKKKSRYSKSKKELAAHIKDDRVNHPDVTGDKIPWVIRKFQQYNVDNAINSGDDRGDDGDDRALDAGEQVDHGDTDGWINVVGAVALYDTSNLSAIQPHMMVVAQDNGSCLIGSVVFTVKEVGDNWRKFGVGILAAYHPIREIMKVRWFDNTPYEMQKEGCVHDMKSKYIGLMRDKRKDQAVYYHVLDDPKGYPPDCDEQSVEALFHWISK
jgi:hypothetical protein